MKIIYGEFDHKRSIRIPKFLAEWIIKKFKGKPLSDHILVDSTEYIDMSHKGIIWGDLIYKFYYRF